MDRKVKIRLAQIDEYERVKDFYYDVIDGFRDAEYSPMWEKGVYPTDEYLYEAIEKQELYVGMVGEGMVAAMVLNHHFNEGYNKVHWLVDAVGDEIQVIHTLCVHPKVGHRGLAKEMAQWAIENARELKKKTLRLDVLQGNVPAEKLYPSSGFKYITTERMYYDDTDWMDFLLYEYPLNN